MTTDQVLLVVWVIVQVEAVAAALWCRWLTLKLAATESIVESLVRAKMTSNMPGVILRVEGNEPWSQNVLSTPETRAADRKRRGLS